MTEPDQSSRRHSLLSRLARYDVEIGRLREASARAEAGAALQQELSGRLARLESSVEGIRAALEQSDHEIDALQIAAARTSRPWYRDPSITVAVLALVLSITTSVVSAKHASDEERQQARAELTGFIQRLSALPRDNFELRHKYGAVAGANLSSMINAENSLLARQAAGLMEQYPEVATALEMHLVAGALNASGYSADAKRMFERAITASRNYNDELVARRGLSSVLMAVGDSIGARHQLRQALALRTKYPDNPPWYINFSDHQTEIMWAHLENAAGNCSSAEQRLGEAYRLLTLLPPGAWLDGYRMQADSIQSQLRSCRNAGGGGPTLQRAQESSVLTPSLH